MSRESRPEEADGQSRQDRSARGSHTGHRYDSHIHTYLLVQLNLLYDIQPYIHTYIRNVVGDGANDVAMIQEAHVGVGIKGEGTYIHTYIQLVRTKLMNCVILW